MKEITLEAVVENIPQVTAMIDEQLERLGAAMKAQLQLDVAVDEIFANISHYAYPKGRGDATVRFGFDPETRTASVAFCDSGVPYNPLEHPEPDVTLSAEERAIGGLGIFMVRKTMDRMEYRHEHGQNILTIYKKI